jgi:nucleoside-diphosphate-sugar epimerase
MITCGITGGNGVLGSTFINKYQNKIKFIKFHGDITKNRNLITWFKKNNFDLIVHLAAIVPTGEVDKDFNYANKVNVEGTKNLVDLVLKDKNISWFFFSSTSHVYKNNRKFNKLGEKNKLEPYSNYGITKLKAEKILIKKFKKSKINLCIGRIFSTASYKQDKSFFVPNMFHTIKNNKNIKLTNLNHYRDYISVNDICTAIYLLYKKKYKGIVNICCGKKINLISIVKFLAKKLKKKITIINDRQKPSFLVGNNSRLKKIGWKHTDNIKKILDDYCKKKI